MKKGQVVKCVSANPVREDEVPHLTDGKNYTIVSGEGDPDWVGDVITSSSGFEVVCDCGERIFCIYPECAHANWGLMQ